MGFEFINGAAKSDWLAGTSQQAQLAGLDALFPDGPTLRYYTAAGVHLRTVTHAAGTINTGTTPREWTPGDIVADTPVAAGDATYVIAATAPSGGTDILRADLDAPMTITTASRPNLYPQSGGSGLLIRATGSLPAVDLPAWLSGVAVNEVVAIGASGAGGAAVDAYNGWAYRAGTQELYIAAAGGHSDSADNRVVSLTLTAGSPSWTLRKASDHNGTEEQVSHYASGSPAARHCYHYIRWSETQGRVMLMGCYSPFGGVILTLPNVDGFNPATNTWDAAGTFDDCATGQYGNAHGSVDTWALWETSKSRLWTASTATWSNPTVSYSSTWIRFPWAYDTSRSQYFGLAIGDSQGSGTDTRAIRHAGTTQTDITLNSIGGALAQFATDAGEYPGMDYDAANDCFVWYDGRSTRAGRFYKITPTSGTTWDISIMTVTGDTVPATVSAGINSRFTYVDFGAVSGFVFMPSSSAGLYFLRTA